MGLPIEENGDQLTAVPGQSEVDLQPLRLKEHDRELVPLGQEFPDRANAVEPDVQPPGVEPELHECDQRGLGVGPVHRARSPGGLAAFYAAGAEPLEVAAFLAVDCRRQQRRRSCLDRSVGASRDVGDEQIVGYRPVQKPINVAQVAAV